MLSLVETGRNPCFVWFNTKESKPPTLCPTPHSCTDVFAVLDYYFEHYNNGKPFILAGNSQGARMVSIILEEYMAVHLEFYSRIIAAYRVEDGLTREYLEDNPHVKAVQCADDLGVWISWNTEGPENKDHYGLVAKPNFVCINPLN